MKSDLSASSFPGQILRFLFIKLENKQASDVMHHLPSPETKGQRAGIKFWSVPVKPIRVEHRRVVIISWVAQHVPLRQVISYCRRYTKTEHVCSNVPDICDDDRTFEDEVFPIKSVGSGDVWYTLFAEFKLMIIADEK